MIESPYNFEHTQVSPKKGIKMNKNFVESETSFKIWESLIDKEKVESSHTTLKITIPIKIRPMDRRRIMTTLTGMFLIPDYINRLSTRLAEICDHCVVNFKPVTKDYLYNRL